MLDLDTAIAVSAPKPDQKYTKRYLSDRRVYLCSSSGINRFESSILAFKVVYGPLVHLVQRRDSLSQLGLAP